MAYGLQQARRLVVFVVGVTVLLLGIVLLIAPGLVSSRLQLAWRSWRPSSCGRVRFSSDFGGKVARFGIAVRK